jgi:NADH-quinone oxidoreductase subunit H
VSVTLFLGGWRMPDPIAQWWPGANEGWWPLLWFIGKIFAILFVFVWLRGTLPRLRYDQFMRFGWKVLIPVSIAWIMIVSVARVLRNEVSVTTTEILIGGAILIVLLLIGSWIVQSRQDRRDRAEEEAEAIALATPFDPMAGGFPVPPMPGQEFTFTSRRAMAQGTTIVQEPVTVAPDEPLEGTEEGHHG